MNPDWASKDFYKILGVTKTASQAEIKKAYRKLARDNHPDSNPGNKAAEERFKEISEAYSVLSSETKRKEYDETQTMFGQFGARMGGGGYGGGGYNPGGGFGGFQGGNAGDFDLSDLLGGIFGGGGRGRRRQPQGRRGDDLETEASITFEQSIEGATLPLRMTSDDPCHECHGTGAKPGTVPKVCPKCQGSGMIAGTSGGVFAMTEPCDECRGRGMIVEHPCATCHGSGRAPSTRTLQVRVPAGVKDGQRIRLKGKGGQGEGGAPDGDLYLVVHVAKHPVFGRKGEHLTITVPVTFDEAVLGADIQVPTLGGDPVKIRVPAGTASGKTLRARGKGAPLKAGGGTNGRGDLLVTIEVQVPHGVEGDALAAIQAFRASRGDVDPRSALFEKVKR